jgi:hypothetical protein
MESHDERRVILFVSHEQQTTHSAFFYFPRILWQSIASAAISFPHMKLLHYPFCLVSLISPSHTLSPHLDSRTFFPHAPSIILMGDATHTRNPVDIFLHSVTARSA